MESKYKAGDIMSYNIFPKDYYLILEVAHDSYFTCPIWLSYEFVEKRGDRCVAVDKVSSLITSIFRKEDNEI